MYKRQALAHALARRGVTVDLATDARAGRYGEKFPARQMHVIASATVRGRDPISLARTAAMLGVGTVQALRLLARIRPSVVVGFGGYPTVPPVLAAALRRTPTLIHEQNAVMGRANRFLAARVRALALSFPGVLDHEPRLAAKATLTGNPVRPAVIAAAQIAYAAPATNAPLRLVVSGGSQGARIMADVVPPAVERLAPELRARIAIVQQAREEDLARVTDAYARANVAAEVAPFFTDLPARIAASHLVIARAGASTVAELAAIGRPAILVRCPMRSTRINPPMPACWSARAEPSACRNMTLHRTGSRQRSPRLPRARKGSPQWLPRRARKVSAMLPSGSPTWCWE